MCIVRKSRDKEVSGNRTNGGEDECGVGINTWFVSSSQRVRSQNDTRRDGCSKATTVLIFPIKYGTLIIFVTTSTFSHNSFVCSCVHVRNSKN